MKRYGSDLEEKLEEYLVELRRSRRKVVEKEMLSEPNNLAQLVVRKVLDQKEAFKELYSENAALRERITRMTATQAGLVLQLETLDEMVQTQREAIVDLGTQTNRCQSCLHQIGCSRHENRCDGCGVNLCGCCHTFCSKEGCYNHICNGCKDTIKGCCEHGEFVTEAAREEAKLKVYRR